MGNNPQSLIRDDEEFNTPRGKKGDSNARPSTQVSLPPMALIVDTLLWPAEGGSSTVSTPKQRREDSVEKPAPSKQQRIWCTVSVDGRDLGPPIVFPKLPGKRIPLKVEQRHPNSQLILRFSKEHPKREEAKKDIYPWSDNKENHSEGEDTEEEDWELQVRTWVPPDSARNSKAATIQFPLSNLVRYGAPLYTTLCLGVPLDGDTPLQLDLAEALQRGQLVESPKVTITLFRPSRPKDFSDLSAEPQPDIHATLVEDLEPLALCASDQRGKGPTCATQIKGLTRSLKLMSSVAYALQETHFSNGQQALSEGDLGLQGALNEQLCRLQEELQASRRETSRLQAELDEVSNTARFQEERLEKDLARACGELQDRSAECEAHAVHKEARASAEEQVKSLTTELENAREKVKLLNKGKEQWHYELVSKYTDLEAKHTTTCAEIAMLRVDHQAVQESLKQKEVQLRQKDEEVQERLQLKAEQEVQAQMWQEEKLELLRTSKQEKVALQDKLLKATAELEALRQQHQLKLANSEELEQSRAASARLQEELQQAKQLLEATHLELKRTQCDLTNVLTEREVLKAGDSLRQELQLENLQLRDEIKSLRAIKSECRDDMQEELQRGWDELQSLRQAAKERHDDVERARTDLESWTRQHGMSDVSSSWPELPSLASTEPATPSNLKTI